MPSLPAHTFPDPDERRPTILVVEDEFLIRLVLIDYLQDCGFKVLGVGDAEEAIQALQADMQVDLVFSDVRMPGAMDGFGLARWIRANRPGLPVILASGDARKSDTARELCESEPFLAKPYDLQVVVAQIRALVDRKAEAKET